MAYADYEFYTDVYYGNLISEEDFPRLSEHASDYIYNYTQGLADKVTGKDFEMVQKATCAIAEVLLSEGNMTTATFTADKAIASEKVGSYSVSYGTTGFSYNAMKYLDDKKKDLLWLYLGNLSVMARIFKTRSYPCMHRTR